MNMFTQSSKKLVKTLLLFVLSVPLVGTPAFSQTKTISLSEAMSIAIEKNTTIITSRNSVDATRSSRRVVTGNLYPSLDANLGWSRRESDNKNSPVIANTDYSTGLDARVVLFDGFSNWSAVDRADASVQSSVLTFERQTQATKFETIQNYTNVLRTKQLLDVRKEDLKRSNEQLKRITESQKLGGVAIADVYRQQTIVSNDELALIQSQNDYDKAQADLVFFLGLDALATYAFDDNSIPTELDSTALSIKMTDEDNATSLASQALANRSDYKSAQQNLNASRLSVSIAKGVWYPTLSLNGSLGYGNNEFGTMFDNRNTSIGLTLSYPIFNNYSRENSIEQAEISLRNSDETFRLQERQIKIEIKKALLDLDAARKSVEASQTGVRSAIEDRKIAEEKYNLGAGTLLDRLVADANYTAAISNKVNSVYNYFVAKKQLEYVIGTLN